MKQVVLSYKSGELSLQDVPAPLCKPGGVVVRTLCSLISAGTERGLIELGRKTIVGKAMARPDLVKRVVDKARKEGLVATFHLAMGRLDTPTPLGYSSAGEIVEVGAGVTRFQVGDRVACIGASFATHSEHAWVPQNLCAHLPEGATPEEGAYGMLGIIALHGVRCARPEIGHKVVVLGLGLLGQLAVQELCAAGAEVFGIDLDPAKVDLARRLGASGGCVADGDAAQRVLDFTAGAGADSVVITAATHDDAPIRLATDCAAKGARVVLVGVADIHVDRQLFWEKELRFVVSRASGPGVLDPDYEVKGTDYPREYVRWTEGRNLQAFLDLVRRRKVDVLTLTTHRFPIERAVDAFGLVHSGREPFVGVVLTYPADAPAPHTVRVSPVASREGKVGIALVGAGLFARAQFLPALKRVRGTRRVALSATTGVNASHFARKYGFERATTDWRDALADPEVDAVFILTRHDAHAAMVEEALAARKHVFVEKPLCMTEDELARIAAAHSAARDRLLMVGYNRRFAPILKDCAAFLGERRAPATVMIRVNAGAVPAGHWAHSIEEGGGRILSEACHYFDLAMALTGEMPVRVYARAATAAEGLNLGDEAAVVLTLDRGSVAQILYTGAGDRSFSRERAEVFSGGAVVAIDDWRQVELCRNNGRKVVTRFNADLGFQAEIEAFVDGIARGAAPVPFDVFAASTLATLRALRSIESGAAEPCAWKAGA
jgi:predicted dehydrogenase/threonine dehydrogenase-like Zn-dependent dehydrogenase